MPKFEMIKYHRQQYPSYIPLNTEEVAGHFDVTRVQANMPYSLHTEYSYGKRSFSNSIISNYSTLVSSNKNKVPQLWKNAEWAREFAKYIIEITKSLNPPQVIEIHPPFDDYSSISEGFIPIYKMFESQLLSTYPDAKILIENRCGSIYTGGKFAISNMEDLTVLCDMIEREKLQLKIALDIPQLYTAHKVTTKNNELVGTLLEHCKAIREYIGGVHLWGKTTINGRRSAHCGNLDTYFYNNNATKKLFIESLETLFNDNVIRNLVLEVNSNNSDLLDIITDLETANFEYM